MRRNENQAGPKNSKEIQRNPRKKEVIPSQKDLDSLGFLRPIRAFSMGYSRKPKNSNSQARRAAERRDL
jgi:hypothetical protein